MRMPKFTAGVSLYKMNRHYQLAEVWAGNPSEQVESAQLLMPSVLPQPCNGNCPSPCKVNVGPCTPDPSSSTGYSRCVRDADCIRECGIECRPPPPPPPPPPICTCTTTKCCPGTPCSTTTPVNC
jgi:hypothetical protein